MSSVENIKNSPEKIFSQIIKGTMCPFASKARVDYASLWDENTPLPDMIKLWHGELEKFSNAMHDSPFDGFVLVGVGDKIAQDIATLSEFVRTVLDGIAELDCGQTLDSQDIIQTDWQFTFSGQRMFLVTFASFYPENNPRHSSVNQSVIMFLQPEFSFDRFIPHSEHDPRTHRLKENIRRDFSLGGMPYDKSIVGSPHDPIKYIKPLNLGEAPVRWWEK